MKKISKIVKELKRGKVIVCPTDTVYGLIADATNKKAVERVFKIKKRPKNKALPIFVKDIKMAKDLAEINEKQEKFLKKAWPGKVTVILKLKTQKSKAKSTIKKLKVYGIEKKTIALRIPKYKLVLDLLKKINKPLTGTSANISGEPASTNIKEILKQFKRKKYQPDLVIDTGNLPKSKSSTIIDLTTFPPKILRE